MNENIYGAFARFYADEVVPYEGGPSRTFPLGFPVVPDWAEWWADHNGCQTADVVTGTVGDISGIHYSDCSSGAYVIFYTIPGGGHTWPGGEPLPAWPGGEPLPAWLVGETTYDIDATRVMWLFFQQHPME